MLAARDMGSGWTKISFDRNVEQYGGSLDAFLGLVPQLGWRPILSVYAIQGADAILGFGGSRATQVQINAPCTWLRGTDGTPLDWPAGPIDVVPYP